MVNVIDRFKTAPFTNVTGALPLQPAFFAPLLRVQMLVVVDPKRPLFLFAVPLQQLLPLAGFALPLPPLTLPCHLIDQWPLIERGDRFTLESATDQLPTPHALLAQLKAARGNFQPAKLGHRVFALIQPTRRRANRFFAPLPDLVADLNPNLFTPKNQRQDSYPLALPCSQNFAHASKNCLTVNLSAGLV